MESLSKANDKYERDNVVTTDDFHEIYFHELKVILNIFQIVQFGLNLDLKNI